MAPFHHSILYPSSLISEIWSPLNIIYNYLQSGAWVGVGLQSIQVQTTQPDKHKKIIRGVNVKAENQNFPGDGVRDRGVEG